MGLAITACRPVRMRSPSCSIAESDTTSSRAAPSINTGVLIEPGNSSRAAVAMARMAAAVQRMVGEATSSSGRAASTSAMRI